MSVKFSFNPKSFLSIKVQIACMLITFACMFIMLYKTSLDFTSSDALPAADDYNIENFVEKFKVQPAYITTGITLLNFLQFNAENNDFIFDAMMSFDYNPQQISPKVVDRFEFTRAHFIDKYIRDEVKIAPDHTRVEYYVKVNFSVDFFNYERFPLDDHIISINLINPATDAKEVLYKMEAKDFILSSNLTLPGWKVLCHRAITGFRLHEDGDNVAEPILSLSLCLAKQDIRHIMLILFPLFIIFFGSFFSFALTNIQHGIDLARSGVVGLLAYDYIIITISPKTAYFMLSDYIFLLFLVANFAIYLVLFVCGKMSHAHHIELLKSWTSIIILVLLFASWYILISFKGATSDSVIKSLGT